MKKILALLAIALLLPAFALAGAPDELKEFAAKVNVKANLDLGVFKARVAAEFGTTQEKVEAAIKVTGSAGDAYMAIMIGNKLKKPPEEVAAVYVKNKGKGWGYVAKQMGIKPGSPEFHALKKGKFLDNDDDHGKGAKSDDHGKGGRSEGEKGGKAADHGKSKK